MQLGLIPVLDPSAFADKSWRLAKGSVFKVMTLQARVSSLVPVGHRLVNPDEYLELTSLSPYGQYNWLKWSSSPQRNNGARNDISVDANINSRG